MTTRRAFLAGLGSLLAAPAIVQCSNLMSLRGVPLQLWEHREVGIGYVITRQAVESMTREASERWREHLRTTPDLTAHQLWDTDMLEIAGPPADVFKSWRLGLGYEGRYPKRLEPRPGRLWVQGDRTDRAARYLLGQQAIAGDKPRSAS